MTKLELEKKLQSEDITREYKVKALNVEKFTVQDLVKVSELHNNGLSDEEIEKINPIKYVYKANTNYTVNGVSYSVSLPNYVESEDIAISRLISMIKQSISFV